MLIVQLSFINSDLKTTSLARLVGDIQVGFLRNVKSFEDIEA